MRKSLVLSPSFFLLSLCGAWMMGIGLRMFIEISQNDNTVYISNSFDLVFDWSMLFILGLILVVFAFFTNYKKTLN